MEEKNEVIRASGYYDGNNLKSNYDVQLKFKFPETSLADAIQFIAGIGKRIALVAIIPNEVVKLGKFFVYSLKIDKDGNCGICFKSNADLVCYNNFSKLLLEDEEIVLKAKILKEI